jgi:hypothetical protein
MQISFRHVSGEHLYGYRIESSKSPQIIRVTTQRDLEADIDVQSPCCQPLFIEI